MFAKRFERCQHRYGYTERLAMLYCVALACAYVAALYLLVPGSVRKLDRDHARHIRFRCLASVVISIAAVTSYSFFFCRASNDDKLATFSMAEVLFQLKFSVEVLAHTIVLYTGSIVASLFGVWEEQKLSMARKKNKKRRSYPRKVFRRLIRPTILSFLNPITPEERWKSIRNLIIAPWTEEVVFRGCMVPVLLGSGMSPLRVTLLSPLFFGVAHAHHAMTRLAKGERAQVVLIMTIFQFIYTSLFGSYATYAFIRTGSVMAVTLSHAYCNWMGLPDFRFVQPHHPLYYHRMTLFIAYLCGVFAFKWGFSSSWFLPYPPQLPAFVGGVHLESGIYR